MARKTKQQQEAAKAESSEEASAESTEEVEEASEEMENEDASAESESEPKPKPKTKTAKKEKDTEDAAKKRKKKRRNVLDAHHPPTTEMVLEALMELDERKGTTIKAIKDHIMSENTVRPESLKHLLRSALTKLVAKEKIIRPKGEENKSVLMGRYKIAPRARQAEGEKPQSVRSLRNSAPIKKKKKKRRSGSY